MFAFPTIYKLRPWPIMPYRAGGFYMPTSGGLFSVTEMGFTPQGVMFFGGNQATEDAFITPTNPGVFFGMVWIDHATETIDQQACSNIWNGFRFKPVAITMARNSGTIADYEASVVSLDEDGFTLNVTTPAIGSRPIHWLAYGDFDGAHGSTMFSLDNAQYQFDETWRPKTSIAFHFWPNQAVRDRAGNGANFYSMGVNNFYPGYPSGSDNAMSMIMRIITQLGAVGPTNQFVDFSSTGITLTARPGLVGTITDALDHNSLYSAEETGIQWNLNGYPTRHSGAWWTGEAECSFAPSVPAVGAEVVQTAAERVGDVEACLFFGTTGYGSGNQSNPNTAYMFGVLTDDYQGCVGYDSGVGQDGPANGTPGFFQSRNKCYVTHIQTPGVRASSGELIGNEVHLTGEIADGPVSGASMIQMYGAEAKMQQFFRVVHR